MANNGTDAEDFVTSSVLSTMAATHTASLVALVAFARLIYRSS